MTEVTIIPLKHPVLISFPEQSDYENNKARIKRIIKTKHKLKGFNENDTEKSIVVKRKTAKNTAFHKLLNISNVLVQGNFAKSAGSCFKRLFQLTKTTINAQCF